MNVVTELTNKDKENGIVYFTSPTCAPCKVLGPIMEEISEKYSEVAFFKVSIDQAPELTLQETVRGVPTVKFYQNGHVAYEFIGLKGKEEYENAIKSTYLEKA